MTASGDTRLAYLSIIIVVIGAVAVCAMVYGFSVELTVPKIELKLVKKALVEWTNTISDCLSYWPRMLD